MTTLNDLLLEIGRLYMENVMLRRALESSVKETAPAEEREENNEPSSEVTAPNA